MGTVAVDVGQSGTRSLAVQGSSSRRGAAGGYWSDAVESVVLTAVGAVAPPGEYDIGVGLTGYDRTGDHRERVVTSLAHAGYWGTVTLADDAVTAHLGAFGGRPGVVISAGTGAVVLHSDGRRAVRVDGLGYELGDRGSGYWIGRTALRAALLEEEGGVTAGQESMLLIAARGRLGDDLRHRLAIAPPSVEEVAAFARAVAEAARRGDLSAARILAEAGTELARSAGIALRRADDDGPVEVCLVGGLVAAGPALTGSLAAGLPPGCRLIDARGDALDGALLLARQHPDTYGDLLSSFVIDHWGTVAAGGGQG